jgi:hypothetical protein
MTTQDMASSLLFWGMLAALLMILFYIGFLTWAIVVVFHDWRKKRRECRCFDIKDTEI